MLAVHKLVHAVLFPVVLGSAHGITPLDEREAERPARLGVNRASPSRVSGSCAPVDAFNCALTRIQVLPGQYAMAWLTNPLADVL